MHEPGNMTSNVNHNDPHLEEVVDRRLQNTHLYLANPSLKRRTVGRFWLKTCFGREK